MAIAHTDTGQPIVRLYVSNVSPLATEEELAVFLRGVAPYLRMRIIRNIRHGLCARFAFLDVAPEHEATIIDRLDGSMFMDRHIGILRVLTRPDRPGPDGV